MWMANWNKDWHRGAVGEPSRSKKLAFRTLRIWSQEVIRTALRKINGSAEHGMDRVCMDKSTRE